MVTKGDAVVIRAKNHIETTLRLLPLFQRNGRFLVMIPRLTCLAGKDRIGDITATALDLQNAQRMQRAGGRNVQSQCGLLNERLAAIRNAITGNRFAARLRVQREIHLDISYPGR